MLPHNAPRLEDWLTPAETAGHLKITRQTVHSMILRGEFSDIRVIGPESKPQYLVSKKDVEKRLNSRRISKKRIVL